MISKFFIYYHNDVMYDLDSIHGFTRNEVGDDVAIELLTVDGPLDLSFDCSSDDDSEVLQIVDDIFDELCLFKAMIEYKKENNDTLTVGDMSEFKHLHPMGKYPNLIRISLD